MKEVITPRGSYIQKYRYILHICSLFNAKLFLIKLSLRANTNTYETLIHTSVNIIGSLINGLFGRAYSGLNKSV